MIFGILTAVPAAAHSALLQDAPPPSENSLVHPTPHQTDATVEPPPAIEPIASIALSAAAIACAAWIIRRRLFDPVPLGPSREWPLGGIADWPVVLLGGMVAWVA
ncbi:MAG: hypothetical protein JNK58_07785, partial [Phycisphaerae bacterium]|nr:hypothetical protein [Phycisphaerae bacterium]